MIKLTLETGEIVEMDPGEVASMSREAVVRVTPTHDGFRQYAPGQCVVMMKDGRVLALRHRHPGCGI